MSEAYKSAGVDIEAGYEAVRLMKEHIEATRREGVLSSIGGFSGLFGIDKEKYKEPVLVSGTDGVGTKLKLAFLLDKHDTVGQDCVAMCVNDIVCSGAEPLFFLDYIAVGKNYPDKVASIVKGIADGCIEAGCALIGGETAEMPGFYAHDEYDLAGFAVGIVDREKIIDGKDVRAGDKLIGLASSGLHSNGYSLVRKAFNINAENIEKLRQYNDVLGCTLGEELLKPTRIYVKTILALKERFSIKAVSHITGGGFFENVPRMLPEGCRAVIRKGSFEVKPIFKILQSSTSISDREMYNTFNMGVGMVVAVPSFEAEAVIKCSESLGERAWVIGEVVRGERGVEIC